MSTETVVETPAPEAAEKPAKAVKVATPCACSLYTGKDIKGAELTTGCDAETIRTFGPGHDAKLKSLLIKTAIAGLDVTKKTDTGSVAMSPVHAAEEYGFRPQVEKGLETHNGKAVKREEAAKERQAARDAKKAEKDAAKAERKRIQEERKVKADALKAATDKANADKTPGPARAKVGRTEYDGEVLADGTFRYEKDGEQVETEKYTIVVDSATIETPVAAN
jgi:hypothetical protein